MVVMNGQTRGRRGCSCSMLHSERSSRQYIDTERHHLRAPHRLIGVCPVRQICRKNPLLDPIGNRKRRSGNCLAEVPQFGTSLATARVTPSCASVPPGHRYGRPPPHRPAGRSTICASAIPGQRRGAQPPAHRDGPTPSRSPTIARAINGRLRLRRSCSDLFDGKLIETHTEGSTAVWRRHDLISDICEANALIETA